MFQSVLVVCIGNICRSPLGERALLKFAPHLIVRSAGLHAVVGSPADMDAAAAASERDISLGGHIARQLTTEMATEYDLILVMEPSHKADINRKFPQFSGKSMLFAQWTTQEGIDDPYLKPFKFHQETRDKIIVAAEAWSQRLGT